jgi:hypothetical protein
MAEWTNVDRIAAALPEVTFRTVRGGLRQWRVKDKPVAWERPLRKSDFEALGESAPDRPILGVRVPDLVAKEALVADDPMSTSRHRISTAIPQSSSSWSRSHRRGWRRP